MKVTRAFRKIDILGLLRDPFGRAAEEAFWARDPLSHPVLSAMTERDLADLPFDPHRISPE